MVILTFRSNHANLFMAESLVRRSMTQPKNSNLYTTIIRMVVFLFEIVEIIALLIYRHIIKSDSLYFNPEFRRVVALLIFGSFLVISIYIQVKLLAAQKQTHTGLLMLQIIINYIITIIYGLVTLFSIALALYND